MRTVLCYGENLKLCSRVDSRDLPSVCLLPSGDKLRNRAECQINMNMGFNSTNNEQKVDLKANIIQVFIRPMMKGTDVTENVQVKKLRGKK